jgi:anaerobic ribonucleoside-triphosphate reductase
MTTHQKTEEMKGVEVKVPCEVYSRIVGYLRPVQNWHDGKKREFEERVTYRVPEESE